jgi:putative transposase
MVGFIDAHWDAHGVEPICEMLPIAPATCYEHWAKRAYPTRLSDRAKRDEALRPEIQRVFDANWQVYGVRKVWRQLRREGFDVARCTVAQLWKSMAIQGIFRGKPQKTTVPGKKLPCPLDKVNRQFRVPAPDMLWVSDFTCAATWKGFVHVAPRHGHSDQWRSHGSILDALEQAVHDRRPGKGMGLVHHSDRGSRYLSIKYTERLAEAGIEPSVGSLGDSDECVCRDDQRPFQVRGHPPPRTLAPLRGRRIRHSGMGRLVQQPLSAGAHREHTASRNRGKPLRRSGNLSFGRVTKCNQPPAKPARFTSPLVIRGISASQRANRLYFTRFGSMDSGPRRRTLSCS